MKQKFKLKINVFDIIIILLVIAAGFLVLRLSNADGGSAVLSSGTPMTMQYTLEMYNLPEGLSETIKPGDSLTEAVEKRYIGRVVSVEHGPYMTTSKDSYTGNLILTEMVSRYTATLVVELDVVDTGTELDASGFILRANATPSVLGPGYSGMGLITAIER